MDKGIKFVATGIPETVHAFDRLADMDLEKAERKAGEAVLPAIKANTRHDSGAMQGSWNMDGGTFVNEQDYASYQEFGTRFVPAADAIRKAWDQKQDAVEKAFSEEIENAAAKQDLTLDVLPEPRHITLNVAGITPGNLTLMDSLDIAEVSGVDADEMIDVIKGPQNARQGRLLYAFAWVIGRRVEPGLTFEEVIACHLHVVGSAATDEQIEAEQKRAVAVASVAMLAGVTPDEAEAMTIAEVAAVTSITKARRRNARRK